MLKDIAILTSGTMISEDLGIELETVSLDMLGSANGYLLPKRGTVVAGAGKKKISTVDVTKSGSNRRNNVGLR